MILLECCHHNMRCPVLMVGLCSPSYSACLAVRKCFVFSTFRSKFGNFSLVEPENVSPSQPVPCNIHCPPWAHSGIPGDPPAAPDCKSQEDLGKMRRACRLASKILHAAKQLAKASTYSADEKQLLKTLVWLGS